MTEQSLTRSRSKAPRGRDHSDKRISEVEKIESDPKQAVDLAAAVLQMRFHNLLATAFRARPDITQRDLSEVLGVSEGRVSQVLHGDDSLRIVTIARYLRALGYEVHPTVTSVSKDAPSISGSGRINPNRTWDAAQLYVSVVLDGAVTMPQFTITHAKSGLDAKVIRPPEHIGSIEFELGTIAGTTQATFRPATRGVIE
jgi:transcriptional regulator with XRE-family HTH domain